VPRVRRGLGRAWRWLLGLADRRLGALVLFGLALLAYGVQAAAWPLGAGRDLDEYLYAWIQLFDADPVLPWSMLFRTPVTPIVIGPLLDVAGGSLAEPFMAVLYALSIVAWSAAARAFGPRAALAVAVALLAYPGYAAVFHVLSSEPLFAAAFSLWALLVVRAAAAPSTGRFAAVGLATALVALVRPGNVVLVAVALLALAAAAPWRRRLAWAGVTVLVALLPLAGWAVHNGLRFDEWTVARGGNAVFPFYRVLLQDRIVSPAHGDASRRLGRAVSEHLLTREPYRSYGITLDDVFTRATARVHEDMYILSDEVFGWKTDYSVLREAALEGVRAEPGAYVRGVLKTIWLQLSEPYYVGAGAGPAQPASGSAAPPTKTVDGRELPRPSEGQLIPGGQNLWILRPDNAIRQVWTSPTEHHFVFADPSLRPRFEEIVRERDALFSALPDRSGTTSLARRLDQVSRWYPRAVLLVLVGVAGIALRRPRAWLTLVALALAAVAVVSFNALGLLADRDFMIPVAPAFVVFAAGGLLGPRSARRRSRRSRRSPDRPHPRRRRRRPRGRRKPSRP
jgi:hypothetical protein